MKKCLMTLLVLLLLASMPVTALADNTVYTEGVLYYTVGDDTITIVGCFGKNESITVPNSIGGLPVNTIASGAFVGNKYLKTLYLPDTITTVEGGAIGGGINVIYNYNVQTPVNPTPAPEEEVEYIPSVEVPETPEPQTPETQPPQEGTGSTELEDEPTAKPRTTPIPVTPVQPTPTPRTQGGAEEELDEEETAEPVIEEGTSSAESEGDVDLDAMETEEPTPTEEPESTAAPTEAPTPEPTPEQTAPTRSGVPAAPILIGLGCVLAVFVIAFLAKRRKQ